MTGESHAAVTPIRFFRECREVGARDGTICGESAAAANFSANDWLGGIFNWTMALRPDADVVVSHGVTAKREYPATDLV